MLLRASSQAETKRQSCLTNRICVRENRHASGCATVSRAAVTCITLHFGVGLGPPTKCTHWTLQAATVSKVNCASRYTDYRVPSSRRRCERWGGLPRIHRRLITYHRARIRICSAVKWATTFFLERNGRCGPSISTAIINPCKINVSAGGKRGKLTNPCNYPGCRGRITNSETNRGKKEQNGSRLRSW